MCGERPAGGGCRGGQRRSWPGRLGLPLAIRRLRPTPGAQRAAAADGRLYAVMQPDGTGGLSFDGHVVDGEGRVVLELTGYRTVELPGGADAEALAPLAAAMAAGAG